VICQGHGGAAQVVVTVEKPVEVPVDRIVYVDKEVIKEIERVVTVTEPSSDFEALKARLNQPQAPCFSSQSCVQENREFKWVAAQMDTATVHVVHSELNGWQRRCSVTLYATCDGTEPSKSNYDFSGPSPLAFRIQKSTIVKAVAISESAGASIIAEAYFTRMEPAGVGMLLEKMRGLKGIYVQEVIEGGVVWMDGTIQPGDEIKMIDNERIEHLELSAVTRLILGHAGSKVRWLLPLALRLRPLVHPLIFPFSFTFLLCLLRFLLDASLCRRADSPQSSA
jgi:hypothetical protein